MAMSLIWKVVRGGWGKGIIWLAAGKEVTNPDLASPRITHFFGKKGQSRLSVSILVKNSDNCKHYNAILARSPTWALSSAA